VDFLGDHHVYAPHRAGLPPLGPYIAEAWRRREFAAELSRATARAQQSLTVLGRIWNILNPLLLACVYWLLIVIIGGRDISSDAAFFPHLLLCLFTFYFIAQSMTGGANSVVGAGKMITNTAFPRVLLPLSAVRTAFYRFLPTLAVYAVLHVFAGLPFGWVQLWAIPLLGLVVLFAAGLAMLMATLQVYFRDTTSFLPYMLRIWLYVSPIIWLPELVLDRLEDNPVLLVLLQLNPLFGLMGSEGELVVRAIAPTTWMIVGAIVWPIIAVLVGGWAFLSREREFAVRL
jgi:teichoic acid transport system permease protein